MGPGRRPGRRVPAGYRAAGRAGTATYPILLQVRQHALPHDLRPEVSLVERTAEHDLVQALELGEREPLGQELQPEGFAELQDKSGQQFDPHAAAAFCELQDDVMNIIRDERQTTMVAAG